MGGIVCESSAVDQQTQSLSAFKIIDQINVNIKSTDPTVTSKSLQKITIPLSLQVISLWKRNKQSDQGRDIEGKIVVEIIDPRGEVLAKHPINVLLPLNKIRSRTILNIQGMPVSTTGEYCVQMKEVNTNGKESSPLAKLCFDLILNKE